MTPPTAEDRVLTPLSPRLAAVLAVDVVDYSRLIADDPRGTIQALKTAQSLLRQNTEAHGGRICDMSGDAMIAVFDTAIGAVVAASMTQDEMERRALGRPENPRMLLRMGIHLGDVLEQPDGSIFGNAVNIAARLESLAEPGGVIVSYEVRAALGDHGELSFDGYGEFLMKNIDRPVRVYALVRSGAGTALGASSKARRKTTKGNLPTNTPELLGRDGALREVRLLLDSGRLVTLFGMGGVGKTSLAIEVARRAAPDFPDGAWFVDLAAVQDPSAVLGFVAGLFGVTHQAGRCIDQGLFDALSAQRLLIILDNCEHVTAEAARLATAILGASAGVKIIATSREALSVREEQVCPLAPLKTSGADAPACALFVARARSVLPGFDPLPFQPEISRICDALDGIPLAVELAAARVRSLGPRQIEARLSQRFRLLTGGSRSVRERHKTLLHAVQWSFDLLDAHERRVLTRAAVFVGGFTLEAAEAVCASDDVDVVDICDIVDSLVRKSLLTVTRGDESVRYGMLETIRAFGVEMLVEDGGDAAARAAHSRYYADEADRYFGVWRSPSQAMAHEWLDLELNNLRSAFRFALGGDDIDTAARIASSVGDMARFRLIEEAANWAEDVVERARSQRHRRLAILLTWSASSAWAHQRFDDAHRFGTEAIALLDDPAYDAFVWAYGDLAFVALFAGDIPKAIELLATGAAHPADAHDRFILAFHLFILATAGRAAEARRIADDVVAKVDAAGVPMAIAIAHGARGAALEGVDDAAALEAYEHSIAVARASGARFMESLIAPRLAALHARSGEPAEALRSFGRMLQTFGDATDIAFVSAWRTALIVLFSKLGHFQAAATLNGTLVGVIDGAGVVPEHADAVIRVRDALGERVFASISARGAAMSLREVSDYATVQVELGLAVLEQRFAV